METIDKLTLDFIYYAKQHELALHEGSGKRANYWRKRMLSLSEKCMTLNYGNIFEDLLSHEDEFVRFWAASFCMKTVPKKAEKVLRKLLKSSEPWIWLSAQAELESIE